MANTEDIYPSYRSSAEKPEDLMIKIQEDEIGCQDLILTRGYGGQSH